MRRTYLLVATACGSPNQSPKDSGTVADTMVVMDGTAADAFVGTDAMPDAPPDALPVILPSFECDFTQPGTVRVRTAGANDPLVIHDVFGKVVSRTTSGAAGVVDVSVPGCGAVTAVTGKLFHTITYVRDGDELWINAPPEFPAVYLGPARLYIDTPAPGASNYWFVGPVSGGMVANEPLVRDVTWGSYAVDAQGLTAFAVHAIDPMTGYPDIDTYHFFDVSLSDAMQSPLHLTSWSTQTATQQVRLQFAQPTEVAAVGIANWAKDSKLWSYAGPTSPAATVHDVSIERSAYGTGLIVGASFRNAAMGNLQSYSKVVPLPQAQLVIDLSQELLPEIATISIAPSTSTPTVSWTFQSAPVNPDLMILRVLGPIEWRFALPPGMTSFRFPELPPDLAQNFSTINVGLSAFEASDYSGYAAARGRFIENFVFGRLKVPMGLVLRSTRHGDVAF